MRVITVSREFGSGGRELAKRLADVLGVQYYDREILSAIADKCRLDERYVEDVLNKKLMANYPITFSQTFSYIPMMETNVNQILFEQHKIIKEFAEKEDCIIVGRCADIILQDQNPFKLFVYAETEAKVQRCMDRKDPKENYTEKEIEKKIKQIDRARASYHNVISNYDWGDKRGYDLCVNTTNVNIKEMVPVVAQYINLWFDEQKV